MKDFFNFKKMISVSLVKVLYFIGFILITLWGLAMLGNEILIGVSILTVGNLLWRIMSEGMIIMFSIHDSLVSIEKNVKGSKSNDFKQDYEINNDSENLDT